jgi:hypothetical protein
MKKMMRILGSIFMMLIAANTFSQKIDEQRMKRDIEVAENVLGTLLRQQFDRQKMFFPLEVKGSYQPGYGITFRLPADFTTPIVFSFDGMGDDNFVFDMQPPAPGMYSYSYNINSDNEGEHEEMEEEHERMEEERDRIHDEQERIRDEQKRIEEEQERIQEEQQRIQQEQQRIDSKQTDQRKRTVKNVKVEKDPQLIVIKDKSRNPKDKIVQRKRANLDSIRNVNNAKMIEAAKDFLADYGDLISQLSPEEKIIITNQGEQPRMWVGKLMNSPNRTHLSIEVTKGDITQFKQGKMNHDQLMSKIKVVNTETVEAVEPDLELLSSIFDRLYQPDLARTYFTENRLYYERLKDYGVVYYMQVYSSNENDYASFSMPTLKLKDLDQKTRDEKVKSLYPEFEKELKENILEYGRTVKSLKDDEVLVFNVKLTKCKGCGIPSTLEVSVKGSVLKEYGNGKTDKASATNKLMIKKGADQ